VGDARDRTTISVGALITAVALFAALVIMVHSFRGTVSLWVNQTLEGDLFARPKMAGLNQYRDPIPEPAAAWLKEVSEETELMPYRRLFLSDGGMPYQLEATCLDVFLRYGRFFFLDGDPDRIAAPLLSGEGVIVSEVFSVRSGLTTGDRFRADLGNARLDLPILGVFRDYRTRGGVVIMELAAFQEITRDRSWGGAVFFFKDRRQDLEAAAERLLARIANGLGTDNPLEMASGAKLRREVMQIFDETFAVTTVLLIIALVVAGLGIATTLSVLVMERMRQINTLVAVGASLRQVRSMIFWEAVFLVAVGQGIGIVCGFFMSYILIYVINLQSFGWTFLYRVDWNALLTAVPLILAAALAAALPAVRLVVRSSPALVLREQ
jgi:putative ABC transport system permease protein